MTRDALSPSCYIHFHSMPHDMQSRFPRNCGKAVIGNSRRRIGEETSSHLSLSIPLQMAFKKRSPIRGLGFRDKELGLLSRSAAAIALHARTKVSAAASLWTWFCQTAPLSLCFILRRLRPKLHIQLQRQLNLFAESPPLRSFR